MRNANWHECLGNAAVFKGFMEPGPEGVRPGPASRADRPGPERGKARGQAPDKRGLTQDRWCAKKGPAED